MKKEKSNFGFDIDHVLHELHHYLPAQAPLKDFVHHNTLHAFQHHNFHDGMQKAAQIFGYQVYLTLQEYRDLFQKNKINAEILEKRIIENKGVSNLSIWKAKLLEATYDETHSQRIGRFRKIWKAKYKINLDKYVHPKLFRSVGAFLDQGISIAKFPYHDKPFLDALRSIEKNSHTSIFKSQRARNILLLEKNPLDVLLKIIVGDENYYESYLFEQQFGHPGWSGMVCAIEKKPQSLLDKRRISIKEFIIYELLIELDQLDQLYGEVWKPIGDSLPQNFENNLFKEVPKSELFEVYKIWQEAYEWSYYDQVIKGLQIKTEEKHPDQKSFQAVFCIDDRECSIRRHVEQIDPLSETFGVAGFFNVAFFFQPEQSNFNTKVCPAPMTPDILIKEEDAEKRHKKDNHFNRHTHGFFGGLIIAPTLGLWSALKMGKSILFPSESPAMVSSFKHMDKYGKLTIAYKGKKSHGLQVGFTQDEMIEKTEALLKSIGLVENFASLVYIMGHGASSVNNTYYAGYDCGACSGRAGSVNSRVASILANDPQVRAGLKEKGIVIPESTWFVAALHDTTRDEADYFDEDLIPVSLKREHLKNKTVIEKALSANAKERSRRFLMTNTSKPAKKVHEEVKKRSISLFEPRPEWNHATNTLCIVGKRENNKHLFFDRRAFLNSYDYTIDSDGSILLGILNAIAPVCGGINLEYYFSRVDNYRLGAGSKLPHNVVGLFGLSNGMDGDLRPGLPIQMVNIHDPLRLLITIEHFPEEVLRIMQINPATYEWFINNWINLVVIHPETKDAFVFGDGKFKPYSVITNQIERVEKLEPIFESVHDNLPILEIFTN